MSMIMEVFAMQNGLFLEPLQFLVLIIGSFHLLIVLIISLCIVGLDSRTHLFDEWGNDRIQEHKSMKSKLAPQRIKFNFMFNVSSPQSFTKHNWSMTREMAKKGARDP